MYDNELFNKLEAWGADIENSLGRFMDNEALYTKFIMKFLENTEMEALTEALDKEDYENAITAAHTLKGVAGNLGLTPLFENYAAIVNDMRAGRYDGISELFVRIKKKYDEVCRIISEN